MDIARIIAGRKKRDLSLNENLESLLMLEYFTDFLQENDIKRFMVNGYNVKQIICADYAKYNFYNKPLDFYKECCEHLHHYPRGDLLTNEPQLENFVVASEYFNLLRSHQAVVLLNKVSQFYDLKALLFLDELCQLTGYKIDERKSITDNLVEAKRSYLNNNFCFNNIRFTKNSLSRKKFNFKKMFLITSLTTIVGVSVICGVDYYRDWKQNDEFVFKQNMIQFDKCYNLYKNKDYEKATQCNRGLRLRLSESSLLSKNRKILDKLNGLDDDIKQDLDNTYALKINEIEDIISLGNYLQAHHKTQRLMSKLKTIDYYTNRQEMIKKLERLDKNILDKLEENNSLLTSIINSITDIKFFIMDNLNKIKSFYSYIGFNEKDSEKLLWVTLALPFYFIFRRKIRKIRNNKCKTIE